MNGNARSISLRILAFLWGAIKAVVFLFGVALLVLLIIGFIAFHRVVRLAGQPKLPAHYTLALDFTTPPPDLPQPARWLRFAEPAPPTLAQTIIAIDHAAHDDAVKGLDIQLGGDCCALTTAEELYRALTRFRASGKPVVAHAMSFDGASGLGAYIIGTAASRIELSQAGDFGVTGLALATPFAGAALKNIGVDAQFEHIGKYKTYPQLFTRSQPTPANTEMLNSLADSLYASALAPVAERLRQTPDQVKTLLDQAPFTAGTAKQHGLIDTVLPLDARIDTVRGARVAGDNVGLARYIAAAGTSIGGAGTKIALIVANGDIGAPSAEPSAGGITPRLLVRELRGALNDASVKAIVLRLDTPGGTVTGSAMIGAEVAAAAARKPLIITMGEYDASGGYWISSHGSRLIADPATLTGSIGVLGGKLSFGNLLQRIGIAVTTITRGANASLDSPVETWTQPQLAALQTMLNADYQDFVGWVAQGRHLTPAQVDAIGQGRVWTGIQAKKRGLVDEIGGYHAAFAAARAALHLPAGEPLNIVNGNENPSLHTLLAQAFAGASPLGLLPAGLRAADARAVLALAHLHTLEMPPILVQ